MCCLFGILNYSGKGNDELNTLVNCLAREATIRGTDSTGIAYNKGGKLKIYKKPLSAYDMEFKGIEHCVSITGHTRHATQGSEKLNYNNHPFMGYCDNVKFALEHNGVLWNDNQLRKQYQIAKNKIETDSYIAVQLLENFGELNFENIKKMAESVKGSFSFTMNDTKDNLYIVKGDSPLSIVHFPNLKTYVYASTDNILFTALSQTDFLQEIKKGDFDIITIKPGDIFRINKQGKIAKDKFVYKGDSSFEWWNCGLNGYKYTDYSEDDFDDFDWEYLDDIKAVAAYMGIDEKTIDRLLDEDFTLEEIEDYIYSEYSYTKVV